MALTAEGLAGIEEEDEAGVDIDMAAFESTYRSNAAWQGSVRSDGSVETEGEPTRRGFLNRMLSTVTKLTSGKRKEHQVPTFAIPEEWKSDPLKAIQEDREEVQEEGGHANRSLHQQILYEKDSARVKYVDMFTPGSFNYKRREWCIKVSLNPIFNGIFTTLICANAITLGVQADDGISPNVSFWMESSFTLCYSFELYVRVFASPGYPWRDFAIWLDGLLWIIAAVDLWAFGIMEFLDIAERPNLSTFMVLRLFRITRIVKAAEKFSSVARPLRLLRNCARYVKFLAGAVFGVITMFTFVAAVITRHSMDMDSSSEDSSGDIKEKFFPDMTTAMSNYALIMIGGIAWATDMAHPLRHAQLWIASVTVSSCVYVMRLCVMNIVLAVIVEQLLASGDEETARQTIKRVRDKMNIGRLRRVLQVIDMNGDGAIDANELAYAYEHEPSIQNELGMPLRVALSIHRRADVSFTQRVPINQFIESIFYFKCGQGGVDTMLLEERLKQCQHWVERARLEAGELLQLAKQSEGPGETSDIAQKALQSAVGQQLEPYAKASPRDTWAGKIQAASTEKNGGLSGRVNSLLCDCLGSESKIDMMHYEIVQSADEVEGKLDMFLGLLNNTNWESNDGVSENAIRLASVAFGTELQRFMDQTEEYLAKAAKEQDD
eukprot:TRINITY_DN24054_c0_g1_i1.p1 TRINITY_DN24054_c0_g1~~TRINITY_DN24054_c0_g1_i1.p1  ORF type:complete len:663 (+),score=164.86 TRINITY_DN24054_c0_g1_i1:88-2076(+)